MSKRQAKKRRLLLSFTGFHDPFSPGPIAGNDQEGPILSLLRSFPLDGIVLFSTPRTLALTAETENAIRERFPDIKAETRHLVLSDPTDYLLILTALRNEFTQLSKQWKDADYYVATASGTPQMHACWVLLVASGEIPGRLLQVCPPQFVGDGRPMVSEVDLARPEFPTIRSKAWADIMPSEEGTVRPSDVIQQLGIIGDHPALVLALDTASLVAPSIAPVLILGESGTGKEKVASLIHQLSDRPAGPFVPVNCATIPRELAESTLFGHIKGSFTGATATVQGKFDVANGGSLFLDEVGELSLEVQAKLLRAVQEGIIEPPGEPKGHKVNVRLIAATNKNLKQAVESREFREDLYYRLKVGEVYLPPLRERASDITKLAISFLDEFNASHKKPRRLTPEALTALLNHNWPGNIRELRNTVQRACLMSRGESIKAEHLGLSTGLDTTQLRGLPEPHDGFSMDDYFTEVRDHFFRRALELANGVQRRAAKMLGVTPQAVYKYVKSRQD